MIDQPKPTKPNTFVLVAAAAIVGVTLAACGNSGGDQAAPAPQSGGSTTSAAPAPAAQDGHNQSDVMFAQRMIPHHQQAIEMSDMLLAKDGIDERVVELAGQIKGEQAPEIEEMRSWLDQWGIAEMPMAGTDMPAHDMPGHGDGAGHGMGPDGSMMPGTGAMPMEGMMSAADMAELQNAQGVDAAKLFLEQMIRHHEGAITMARNEIDSGSYPPAIELSERIAVDQQREIDTMRQILATL